jgi:hypothetical protein
MLDRFGMELSVNSAELWIHPQRELSGIVAQPDPLGNAGEDLRRHVVEAVGSRVAAQRSRAEVRVDGRGQFLCRIAKDVVKGVVPDAADPHDRRAVRLLRHHELAREVEDPGDVIVIDVTDHDEVERLCEHAEVIQADIETHGGRPRRPADRRRAPRRPQRGECPSCGGGLRSRSPRGRPRVS